ncbi:MAG: sulfotransferase domain-containing protein [Gammaproteobacteria bacterium]|jgi:hypothetical protein
MSTKTGPASSSNPDSRWGERTPTHDPDILANFKPRATDILITTAPKAGTTWMQQILHQLRTGGDPDFSSIAEVVPWLELPRDGSTWQDIVAGFERIKDPRIFKTHCTYEQTPGTDTVNIILSSRDPRDCCVSFYHHVIDMTDDARKRVGFDRLHTLDDVFEVWLEYGAWYRNIQSWWPHINDNNVLWLRFEDMKESLEDAVDSIIAFLDWRITPQQRSKVLEHSSFDWMKTHSDKFTRQVKSEKPSFKPGGFIRKGEVGDHKTKLSAEQEQRILEKAEQILETDCLRYLGLAV